MQKNNNKKFNISNPSFSPTTNLHNIAQFKSQSW